MKERQRTIARPITFSGVGLHTGVQSTLTFRPAEAGTGVRFIRVDLPGSPEIPAVITNACSPHHLTRRTSLGREQILVSTVEHVLAAVAGLGIDNIAIELNAEEPAEPDGSSLPFVKALREAGLVDLDRPRRYLELTRPVVYRHDGVELTALPNPTGLRLSFTLQYDHPGIGRQFASFDISEDTFEQEISPARTFSLESELDALRSMGLIKGGSLKNAVVVTPTGVMNGEPLRFPNEFVRHKILDLLGDLSLLGMPLKAHVIATRSGHISNLGLVRKLREEHESQEKNLLRRAPGNIPSRWDISDIQQIMPHRYPLLLVDRIIDLKERERVVGIKNVTINEPFFVGHFPGHPIMPAVLIIEAMAQVGGVLLLSTVEPEERDQKLVYFMGIDNARFRKPVIPGDTLRFELELVKLRSRVCKMRGLAFVEGDLVAEADLTSTVVDR